LKNQRYHLAWFDLQARSGQARPRYQTGLCVLTTRLSQTKPGQATGQARLKKSGLLAALVYPIVISKMLV